MFINFLMRMNDFAGFITLFVGGLAIYLYLKQRTDRKRDIAKLILQEIRYAEDKIRKYRSSEPKSYNLYVRLLPTDSWNDNIHLFIKDLKETEVDLISDFYAKSLYIDYLIQKIADQKLTPQSQSTATQTAAPFTVQQSITPEQNISQQGQVRHIEISLFPQGVAQLLLDQVSMNVEFIYNTPLVDRLRSISERKWYQIV